MSDDDVVAYFAAWRQLGPASVPILGVESDAAPENDDRETGGSG